MDIIRAIEQQQIKKDLPDFNVGDNVKVHYRITEGNRERIQVFQGDVIRRHGASSRETFTVRKISFSIGVERTFPVHSPKIDKIEVDPSRRRPPRQAVLPARQGGQGCQDQGEVVPLGTAPPHRARTQRPLRRPFFVAGTPVWHHGGKTRGGRGHRSRGWERAA